MSTSSSGIQSLSSIPGFDPRRSRVLGVDSHLPGVDPQALLPDALAWRFQAPPPWTPESLTEMRFSQREEAPASVLVPLVMRDSPTVLLTLRTAHLSTHSGQIAFPGGRVDKEDFDASATALREAHEEVGLEPEHVRVIGSLPIYTTGSAFIITPVVALVQPGFRLNPNAHEVDDVFEVPLAFLMDPANHRRHAIEWNGQLRHWYSMPYMEGAKERFIWGATAGMLRNLYRFLSA